MFQIKSNSLFIRFTFFLLFTIEAFFTWAQTDRNSNLQKNYQLKISKSASPIIIDGKVNEEAWRNADVADNFWMSYPIDDRRAEKEIQTEVRLTYDDQNVYISAICYGPNDYIVKSLKRDNQEFWDGDSFSLVFDPVNERTNGFSFSVNPSNVQYDALISGQTGRRGGGSNSGISSAWDNKWISEIRTYIDRWIVEIAIPFKTLRYKPSQTTWGLNFIRGEPRTNSYHTWSPVPVQFVGVDLGYTGALIWDNPPAASKSNISIIPYTLASTFKNIEDDEPAEYNFEVGVDAKIAVTSSLNLDLTVNPDFSQVEVDQQVTNLTTFSIRFPERRLFFLENSDLFSDFGIPPMRPFFSRRIGLDEDGNAIPIQYGLRLSGNLNNDLRIGLMNMQTKGIEQSPGNNYTSFALHRQLFKRSVIRGYFHNRQGSHDGELLSDNYNRTVGMEFNYISEEGKWRAFAGYGKSFTDHITSNKNFFYNFGVGYDTRNISLYTNLAGVGDNYYADLGFIPQQNHYDALNDTTYHLGFHHSYTRASYTYLMEGSSKVISHTWELNNVIDATTEDTEIFRFRFSGEYTILWQNTSRFVFELSRNVNTLLYPFDFTDEKPLPAGKYKYNTLGAMYQTDQRKLFSTEVGFEVGEFYNGKRAQYMLAFSYRKQPWGNFNLMFEQNNIKFPEAYGEISLFLIGPRVEINFSNQLSWTTFLQYNTQRDNFNINSRLQWRFQPMSDIFIVYTDNYTIDIWGPKNRALVLKANYWLNL